MLYNIIDTNYNKHWLVKVRKPISWNKFTKQTFLKGSIVFKEKKEKENEILIKYIVK